MSDNPLLAPWTGPFGGVPPLDRVQIEDFEPALRRAMAEKRAEAQAIRDQVAPPTVDNTLAALERMGATLRRVGTVYHLWSANFSSPEYRAVKKRMAPELAELRDSIRQDTVLYERIKTIAEAGTLTSEQARLAEQMLLAHRGAGAHIDEAGRAHVARINQRLSVLYTDFSDHLLADEEGYAHFLDASQLGGLSTAYLDGAKAAAQALGKPEAWAVTNTRSSMEPFLTTSTERALREKVWRTYYQRGDNNDDNDNKVLITEILALRAERAQLLGFDHHAAMVLAENMAQTPERAFELMRTVWTAATAKFTRELEELQALADVRGDGIEIDRWDVRFYSELHRKSHFDFDPSKLQDHLQLDKLREGMFWAATERFGWVFTPIDVPVPHADVTVWSVHNADGTERGLFYFDPFARKGKRSGAWMSAYRVQSAIDGPVLPIVSNNCNYTKAPAGQPTLLTVDDAETLFHEFGHAMHGLASAVTYPMLAGTNVPRDFVEFPSQVNEHWLTTPELLHGFALHKESGAPPDQALLDRLDAALNADSGFMTLEFMASAVLDMEMHTRTTPIDPATFEEDILTEWGLPSQVVMRHRTPQFAHLFSGESYSAGYYSYLWADALTADAAEAFAEVGFYDKDLSAKLMETVLSVGNTIDPAEAFRQFRGRDPKVEPLLRDRGLI